MKKFYYIKNYYSVKIVFLIILGILLSDKLTAQIYVKSTAAGLNNGTSWVNAYTNLQTALTSASAGQEIWVAAGIYYPGAAQGDEFRPKNGVTVYGGFPNSGNPVWGDRNYIINETFLSGDIDGDNVLDAENTYHVIYGNVATITSTAIIDGFTITGGYADTENDGGGIYLINAAPTIRNCKIINNRADDNGGGVYLENSGSVFENCRIENNYTVDDGGGIHLTTNSAAQISSCIINLNSCDEEGAGIYIYSSNVNVSTCDITNNTALATDGGGIYISASNSVIDLCNITGNNAIALNGSNGGGIYVTGASNPTITNNDISNNSSTVGGGIYSDATTFTNNISGNTISGNLADGLYANGTGRGGGLYISNSATGILNNNISNNIARGTSTYTDCGRGGGIYLTTQSGAITGNTISNNQAITTGTGTACGEGGGVYLYRSSSVVSTNNFSNNASSRYGAGVFAYQCDINFSSNTVDNNTVTAYLVNYGYGGGMYIYGNHNVSLLGPNITSNVFSNNDALDGGNATSGYGGGIYVSDALATFSNNQFSNNTSSLYGGAIYLTSGIIATFNAGNTVFGNQSQRGGGIAIRGSSDATFLSGISVFNNSATLQGGGIYFEGWGTNPRLNKSSIYGNTCADGAGIFIEAGPRPLVQNSLIYSNTATGNGGACFFNNGYNPAWTECFLNLTIANNSAVNGGGIYCFNSDPRLRNSILWGNTGTGAQVNLSDAGSDPYFNYCDVSGGTAAFAGTGSGASYTAGNYSNCINSDPLFSDAVFHLTLSTSPCIGKGNPATVSGDFNPADEDFDSQKRVRGIVDIGAYETNNPPQFVNTVSLPSVVDEPGPLAVIMDEDNSPTAFSLSLSVEEVDDETITWNIVTPPSHGSVNPLGTSSAPFPVTVPVTYLPDADYFGLDAFVVEVSDGVLTDLITINITINSINDAPFFLTTPATTSIKSLKTWTYNISTSDVDHLANQLTVSAVTIPAGMTFTPGANGTATLTWVPLEAQVGFHTITIQVDDTGMPVKNSQQTFVFEVISRFIYVPADYPTIQLGIDAAESEDFVMVSDGTYLENINFNGKDISVIGNTADPLQVTIDGNGSGSVVTFNSGETNTSVLSGFTITGGEGTLLDLPGSYNGDTYYGGGIYISNSSPLIENLHIANNIAKSSPKIGGSGAGVYIGNGANPLFNNVEIHNNTAEYYRGGGICVDNASASFQNSDFYNNEGGNYGGAISIWKGTVDLNNVSIAGNTATSVNGSGGGIFMNISTLNLTNVTISGNSATDGANGVYDYGSIFSGTYSGGDNRVDIE